MGCYFLPQGIFLTQESNPCLLHWKAGSLPLGHQGYNPIISGGGADRNAEEGGGPAERRSVVRGLSACHWPSATDTALQGCLPSTHWHPGPQCGLKLSRHTFCVLAVQFLFSVCFVHLVVVCHLKTCHSLSVYSLFFIFPVTHVFQSIITRDMVIRVVLKFPPCAALKPFTVCLLQVIGFKITPSLSSDLRFVYLMGPMLASPQPTELLLDEESSLQKLIFN